MHGRTPYEIHTGQTPDISEYTEFSFYEMLWYYDEMAVFPEDRRKLGRWLGVAKSYRSSTLLLDFKWQRADSCRYARI